MILRRLGWQLFLTNLVIATIAIGAVTWYGVQLYRKSYLEQTVEDERVRAFLIGKEYERAWSEGSGVAIDTLCKQLARRTATRITAILADGTVIGDSERDPATMDNHRNRPEVLTALTGEIGLSRRYSTSVQAEMMYVAAPIMAGNRVIGVVRTSLHMADVSRELHRFYGRIGMGAAGLVLICAVLSLLLSRRISRPVEAMRTGAQRFARGDLTSKIPVPSVQELGELATALNEMALLLDERIQTITRQANEREAILASMVEGIIAVDNEEKIIGLNRSAASMLAIEPLAAASRPVYEVIRHSGLQRFIHDALASIVSIETDLSFPAALSPDAERFMQVRGTALRNGAGQAIGALIVLNDVTRVRQLENVRKDFVANVSHELRTPLTSIKGFVETLQTGALDTPADARRFLDIICQQANRLDKIVEDLLALSAIEKGVESQSVELVADKVEDVLTAAVADCQHLARAKNIRLGITCAGECTARINPSLLQQAVTNLIDNAIKYSNEGREVMVRAESVEKEVRISVVDQGIGIEAQHLGRLFERFYRVDKARSRKLGGTGLGLSIVKHIALAHHATVTVQSTPGSGSVFCIHLPKGK
jgi:two-component system phosphate regulon sensor histidine kinase PhoR